MEKIRYTNFELLGDIIKSIDFSYNSDVNIIKEKLHKIWKETVGEKIIKFAKVYKYSSDNILTIVCADSFVSNELYLEKEKLLTTMNKKAMETGIKIEDVKFDYKKWEEKNYE